jgi:hypothetical protein
MSEPYQELDPETRDRAVAVLLEWAVRQKHRRRPFLELIDGTTLTPEDLLAEPPPTKRVRPYKKRPSVLWSLRLLLRTRKPRAWPHVLNLVAVSAMHGDEDIDVILDEIAGRAEAEGSTGMSAT